MAIPLQRSEVGEAVEGKRLPQSIPAARILVVEDHVGTAKLISRLLERAGYTPLEFHGGQEALDFIQAVAEGQEPPIDMAILDVMMPGVDGFQVCERIRQTDLPGYVPVLMLTALTSVRDKVKGLDLGADDYLTKPFNHQELLARVRAGLRVRQAEQALYQRNRQLAVLHRITQAVNSSLELDDVLTIAMEGVQELLHVEGGALLLADDRRQRLTFVRALNRDRVSMLNHTIAVSEGLVGQVVREGRSLLLNDVRQDPRWEDRFDQILGVTTRSLLCVPLEVREQVIGAIEVVNKRDGPFTPEDQEILELMAASVATATENARLFYELASAYAGLESSRQAIIEHRNRLQALFDGISDRIYVIDANYRLQAVNAAQTRWLGQERNGPLDGLCYTVLYGHETPCPGCQAMAVFTHRTAQSWSESHRRPDGRREEWEINAYPVLDRSGEVEQAILFVRDVTKQRMLEASLHQSEKLAALGQLAAGLAHEINNPLTAILTNTQLLLLDTPPEDPAYESLDLILRASERAIRVVRNLLDFARQEAYDFEPVDLNQTIRNALDLVRHQFDTAGIEVICDLASGLPPAYASRDHLQSVWLNLLLNARDALLEAAEKPQRWVRITTSVEADWLQVQVMDNGVGIPEAHLSRIFEPFFTTKAPGKGTGLGLSTTYQIIQQHQGQILVDSEPDRGTIFTVLLPTAEGEPPATDRRRPTAD
ncbi:MAG: response regulator [Chloroflexi bacterium]|nr:MAG: response regulator [Chloroflexota bacterium]